MLFDKETRHWQEEYRKGNLDDEDMCGETLALLDGSAERSFWQTVRVFAVILAMVAIGLAGWVVGRC